MLMDPRQIASTRSTDEAPSSTRRVHLAAIKNAVSLSRRQCLIRASRWTYDGGELLMNQPLRRTPSGAFLTTRAVSTGRSGTYRPPFRLQSWAFRECEWGKHRRDHRTCSFSFFASLSLAPKAFARQSEWLGRRLNEERT